MKNAEARAWAELLLPVAIGLAIAGTGGWSVDRWLAALPVEAAHCRALRAS